MASLPLPYVHNQDPPDPIVAAGQPVSVAALPWHTCVKDAEFVAEWTGLALTASEPNPFFEPWALIPALQAHDTARKCQLLCVRDSTGLIGIMPIIRNGLYYNYPLPHLTNWMHDNAFVGAPLVGKGREAQFWSALLGWADSHAESALFLHVTHLIAHGDLFAALKSVVLRRERSAAIVHREDRALLCSPLTPNAYLSASMSSKKRKELRRQHRRLQDQGTLKLVRSEDETGLGRWTREFLALEASGWKGTQGSALANCNATAAMFRSTLQGAAKAGKLERLCLTLDNKPIAMLANFITPPGAFAYKTTYDETLARYSPGVLLQLENLALLNRPEIAWCDSCASADHPMIDRIWREKRTVIRVSIAIGGRFRRSLGRQIFRREKQTELEGLMPWA